MKSRYKISIIIPFFNAADYLGRCLDSVIRQDLDDDEVVCVNDGSTDESLAIAEAYASGGRDIKIISQPNRGLSNARNSGMRVAEGEYLMFVDGDDYLEENVLGHLYDLCSRHNLDIIDFRVNVVRDGISNLMFPDSGWESEVSDGRSYLTSYVARYGKQPFVSAWSHLFRRQMIADRGLTFIEGRKYEDLIFTAGAYLGSDRVMYTDRLVYNYVKVEGSITTSGISPVHIDDLHFMARQMSGLSKESGVRIPMDNFFSGIRNHMITAINTGRWREYREYFDSEIFRTTEFYLFRPVNRIIYRAARVDYRFFMLYSRAVGVVKKLQRRERPIKRS